MSKTNSLQTPTATTWTSGGFRHYRWIICALLFFATTINYVDRQVIGILAPTLGKEIGWNEKQYGDIVMCFSIAYAVGMLLAGPMIDRFGTRIGYALALFVWSIAGAAHGLARSVAGFAWARFALGLQKPVISPPPSRQSPNGFRARNARWRPASSTLAPTSVPLSRL